MFGHPGMLSQEEVREICLCPGQLCSAIPACCLRKREERYAYDLDSYVWPSRHAVSGRGKRDMFMTWTVMFGHPGMLSQEEGREICL